MSELLALARRPLPAEDKVRPAAAGHTDCDLDFLALEDDGATLAAMGVTRAVCHGLPQDGPTLSPHSGGLDAPAIRYVIDALPPGPAALSRLHARGVRAIRHRLASDAATLAAQVEAISRDADAVAPLDWHVELAVGADLTVLARYEWELLQLPVALCLTDITAAVARLGVRDENVAMLLDLLHLGRAWIKLGGEIRYAELRGFVNAALAVRSDRLLWGSGGEAPLPLPSDHAHRIAARLNVLERLVPDEDDRAAVLVDNPARLYGFEG